MFPGKDTRGRKPFEVNVRSAIAFREIGKGYEAMHTFTTMMNMPPPLSYQSYNDINISLKNIDENAAKETMLAAVNDLRNTDENLETDIGIDESWQK